MNIKRHLFSFDEKIENEYSFFRFAQEEQEEALSSSQKSALLGRIIKEKLNLFARATLALYYEENLTQKEIATLLGVHKSTVSRSLKKSRQTIGDYFQYVL